MKKKMKKKIFYKFSFVIILFLSFVQNVFAERFQIVPCRGADCGFDDIIGLATKIIDFAFILVLPVAAIVFAYAGFELITSAGNPEKRKKAKTMMIKVGKGIVIILAAWLIVKTIVVTLGADPRFLVGRN